MPITVNFRVGDQEVSSRRFNGGDGVSIYGKTSGLVLYDPPGTRVRVSIDELLFFQDTRTNIFGDYSAFVRLPLTSGRGTVKVERFAPLGVESTQIPISWGDQKPLPLPEEQPPPSAASLFSDAKGLLFILIAGAVAIYALPYVFKEVKK